MFFYFLNSDILLILTSKFERLTKKCIALNHVRKATER